MSASPGPGPSTARLATLLRFLDLDPANLRLIEDAAGAALDEHAFETVSELVARYRSLAPVTPALSHLEALAALRDGRFEDAASGFTTLLDAFPADQAIRFNLSWARAMSGDHEAVIALVDEDMVRAVPRAAALKVQALHHLEQLDEALACGRHLAEIVPDDTDLMGALAVVALDAEDIELSRAYAARAGENADGFATLGTLALARNDMDGSSALFDRALEANPANPRAQLGKGLALLMKGDGAGAIGWIDRGAEGFGDHLGSWIAAGWAHYISGDLAGARDRFEHALALDDSFAESHGAIAVIDLADGRIDQARLRTDVALRLDRTCFSATLAKSLLLQLDGDPDKAGRIREAAMNLPAGPNGQTIAQAAAAMGLSFKPGG